MKIRFEKGGRQVGVLETENLALATKDEGLLRLFREARRNGVVVEGVAGSGARIAKTRETIPFRSGSERAVVGFLYAALEAGYFSRFTLLRTNG